MSVTSTTQKTATLYDALRDAVIGGELEPGCRLSEIDLGRRYQVSRTPIREALVRLQQDGLVERRGSAIFVCDRSADEIIDIYRVRVYLEGAIAFDAAYRRSQTDIMRLESAAALGEQYTGTENPKFLQDANTVFHRALAEACHNRTLQDLQSRLSAQVAKLPSTTLSYPGRWPDSIAEHRDLLAAIRRQDGDRARDIGIAHMSTAADIRSRLIARELDPSVEAGRA